MKSKICWMDYITHLLKYIKFTIVSNLSVIDILRMSETSKSWYKMISMSELWQFMVHQQYKDLALRKPSTLTTREWYLRIKNSGDVYVMSDNWKEKLKLPLTNICQTSECGQIFYFVDVCGDVWCENYCGGLKYFSSNNYDLPCLIEDYGLKPFLETYPVLYGISGCVTMTDEIQKIDCLASVKSIHPTWIGDFILTFDGHLHIFGISPSLSRNHYREMLPGLTYFCDNVKFVGGDSHVCYFITRNNDLYYMDYTEQHQFKSIFVATNVSRAFVQFSHRDENKLSLYYLHFQTLDSINWVYTSDQKIKLSNVSQNITSPYLQHETLFTYPNIHTIDTDVICHNSCFYVKRQK